MRPTLSCVVLSVTAFFTTAAQAELRLPAIFADHMVVQRDREVPVWGWGDPGETVTVTLGGKTAKGSVGDDGRWRVRLDRLQAGGPYALTVTAGDEALTLKDVLVGEVWIASGQSNMEWAMAWIKNNQAEIEAANHPNLRLFTVKKVVGEEPMDDVTGAWAPCTPENVAQFSAVAYYFGRQLNQELDVPVGMIATSWGGTPVESWISGDKLAELGDVARPILDRHARLVENYPRLMEEYRAKLAEWEKSPKAKPVYHEDPGNEGEAKGFAAADFDDSAWETASLPGQFDNDESFDGAVWYRRTIQIPDAWAGKALTVELGAIDDFDVTYFNGERIGSTGKETANHWDHPRSYTIPAERVAAGPAVIAVRAFDHFGSGGFRGTASVMKIYPAGTQSADSLSLAGEWKMFVEHRLDPDAVTGPNGGDGRPREPRGPNSAWRPAGLYNAMIHPLIPYAIRGAIWYQGESNADRAEQYRTLFPAMINDWRARWDQGAFPFLFVQLANYMAPSDKPEDTAWAHLRDAQLHTLRTVRNTGMAIIIDIGDAEDIHPRNKVDVGLRLARWALHDVYGKKDVVKSGPLFDEVDFEKGRAEIEFDFARGLKTRDGGPVRGFTIAGEDQKFVIADAQIVGEKVVVSSPEVPKPVAVRYAWENNPDEANLVNGEGLPASPFRTDKWPGPTDGKR